MYLRDGSQRLVQAAVAAVLVTLAVNGNAHAQFGRGMFGGVGGIAIDADGIVRNLDARAVESLAAERRAALADADAVKAGTLRKVSLAAMTTAVRDAAAAGKPVPSDVVFLGGLQQVTAVFVDPDRHDIVLVGPADTPVVGPAGAIVGAASKRPLLQFEDLVVALRAIDGARAGGIRCSIDPTRDGLARLDAFLAKQRAVMGNPEPLFRSMEQALGLQAVTVGGVPADSRFAQVLVAADYRMKRIGMGLEPSGVKQLPSYLAMVPAGGQAASLPRFWLEAEYDPIARDADELAWRLSGRRMKCLTESDLAGKNGIERGAGRADKVAEKWCDAMTTHYDDLALKQPVFAELMNCVDLAVVAALIKGRQLDARAGLDLAPLLDATAVPLPKYDVPETVPTVASGLKKGTTWVLSASGGVQFQPWQFAANAQAAADLGEQRTAALAARPKTGLWWD
ncbi:MAG: DUF1598 domain-containing protein [Pirellulales bacterium]